jgi:hypothetical protein
MDLLLDGRPFTPQEFRELATLYESNPDYCRASVEFERGRITVALMETALREEAVLDGSDILLARDASGRLIELLTLNLLTATHGSDCSGSTAPYVAAARGASSRTSSSGGCGGARPVRLAVPHATPAALASRTALGWRIVREAAGNEHGRPCVVMHKDFGGRSRSRCGVVRRQRSVSTGYS